MTYTNIYIYTYWKHIIYAVYSYTYTYNKNRWPPSLVMHSTLRYSRGLYAVLKATSPGGFSLCSQLWIWSVSSSGNLQKWIKFNLRKHEVLSQVLTFHTRNHRVSDLFQHPAAKRSAVRIGRFRWEMWFGPATFGCHACSSSKWGKVDESPKIV